MTAPQHNFWLVLLLGLTVAAVGCVDDEVAGDGDCSDDEIYDPIAAECVADTNGDDSNNSTNSSNGGDSNQSNNATNDGNDGNDDNQTGNDGNGTNGANPPEDCGPGAIEGQSCRPDGAVLAGADITIDGVDCDGDSFTETTEADQNGYYDFYDVPAGEHTLTIESGSFSNQQPVTVYSGQTTDLESEAAKVCLEGTAVPIAVLEGTYDDVGSILGGMDIEYDVVGGDMGSDMDFDFGGGEAEDFLTDLDAMMDYDILFIECGTLWSELEDGGLFGGGADMSQIESNIRHFVENGNSLYVSDLAQPFIQMPLPEAVDFYRESDGSSGPQQGAVQDVTANVVSAQMQTLLGSSTTDINYNAGNWAVAEDSEDDGTVHFEADVELSDGQIVDDSALMVTHNKPAGGAAIFTSFHNTDQATGDMEEILEFMIFQL